MISDLKFYGVITNGLLTIKNVVKVKDDIAALGRDGLVEVDIKFKDQRSLKQNSYLHSVLIPEFRRALNSVGYDEVKTDKQAKMVLKAMFCTRHFENKDTGEEMPYVIDTSSMSKKEMSELIEEVIKFCAEHMHYQIPYPNEQTDLEF